jgi:hypothetical protein
MTRREMLQALAASSAVPAAAAQAAMPAAQFAALSKAVTGYAFYDRRAAAAMLSALTAAVGAANIARLAQLAASTPAAQFGPALRAANLEAAAETVIAGLYTGMVNTPRGARVVSYDQALVWQALAWTKPNAFCGTSKRRTRSCVAGPANGRTQSDDAARRGHDRPDEGPGVPVSRAPFRRRASRTCATARFAASSARAACRRRTRAGGARSAR